MVKKIHFILPILLLVIFVMLGAFAYHQVESWNLLDSFYFVIVTITTIGYGDLTPATNLGKIFTMFFSFFGITIAFYLFSMIGAHLFKKHVNQKVNEIKKEVQKQQEIKQDIKQTIKGAEKGQKKKNK